MTKTPQNDDPNKSRSKKNWVLTVALLAGVLGVGFGAGLYAFSGGDDNGSDVAEGGCSINQTLRTALDKAARGDVAAFKALDRGYSVASLAFKDEAGKPKTLGDWNGKRVLVNLWATWCAPCRAEMPALDELQAQLGGDSFEVVPISVDFGEPEKPKQFYADIKMEHAGFFHDGELATLNTLKRNGLAFGLPATLLVDRRGCVLGSLSGPAEWASDDAKALVMVGM